MLFVTEKGYGKRTTMGEFSVQGRGGKGVKCYRITDKTGCVVGVKAVNNDNEVMLITDEGIIIRIACSDISIIGRITSGVKLMNVADNVNVASIAKVREKNAEGDPSDTEEELADQEESDVVEAVEAEDGEEVDTAEGLPEEVSRLLEAAEADAEDAETEEE